MEQYNIGTDKIRKEIKFEADKIWNAKMVDTYTEIVNNSDSFNKIITQYIKVIRPPYILHPLVDIITNIGRDIDYFVIIVQNFIYF